MTGSKEMFTEERQEEIFQSYSSTFDIENTILRMSPTKSNVEVSANNLITSIKEGHVSPFEILARMEAVKLFCEQVREGVQDFTRDELAKYGKEGHKVLKAKFDLAETGVKYHYENDPVWSMLSKDLEAVKEKMKEVEKFLKAIKYPINETNMDTGEITERFPPYKTSTSSFKITLAR